MVRYVDKHEIHNVFFTKAVEVKDCVVSRYQNGKRDARVYGHIGFEPSGGLLDLIRCIFRRKRKPIYTFTVHSDINPEYLDCSDERVERTYQKITEAQCALAKELKEKAESYSNMDQNK